MRKHRREVGIAVAAMLAVAFCIRVAINIAGNSATTDEPVYITAGYAYVVTKEHRLAPWHPPLSMFAAGLAVRARFPLPLDTGSDAWQRADSRRIARTFLYEAPDPDAVLETARLPSLLFGLALILAIGWWARALWGDRAGLAALALAAFEPNLIAHASVATPDIAVTLFCFVSMIASWRYLRSPTRSRWVALLVCCVAAVMSKHVALLLGPLFLIAFAVDLHGSPDRRAWLRRVGGMLGASMLIGIAIVAVAAALGSNVVVAFADGVGDQLWHVERAVPRAYLAGEVRDGFWSYYAWVVALKTPLGILALLALGLAIDEGAPRTRAIAAHVVVPAVVVILFLTWTRVDLGVRLILPAYPFLLVLAARAVTLTTKRWRIAAVIAIASTLLSSTLSISRELGYGNEVARATGGLTRWLSDSNVDWGQDLDRLAAHLHAIDAPPIYLAYFGGGSPSRLGIRHATLDTTPGWFPNADVGGDLSEPLAPCEALRQLIAISVFRLHGVIDLHPDLYGWLRDLEPIATVGTSILVYDVTTHAESHVRLATLFGVGSPTGRCEQARAIALDPTLRARFPH